MLGHNTEDEHHGYEAYGKAGIRNPETAQESRIPIRNPGISCPVVPSWSNPKRHVPLTFQKSFQKTIVNGKQPRSRFPAHEGKFSLFHSSSPKGRPTISLQCLQTNTSEIGFLTCSLSKFFNTRRKYWTSTEKDLGNTQTFHLTNQY